MRHGGGDELVGDHEGPGRRTSFGLEPRECLDERREVGARVAEEVLDPAIVKQLEVGLGGGFRAECPGRHGVVPPKLER